MHDSTVHWFTRTFFTTAQSGRITKKAWCNPYGLSFSQKRFDQGVYVTMPNTVWWGKKKRAGDSFGEELMKNMGSNKAQ